MDRRTARREAKALAAEWIDAWMLTDTAWLEPYTSTERALVRAELERIRDAFEEAGPSLFFRRREEKTT